MSVDYRLLDRFETSRQRHEAARSALPEQWRTDPRPEAQFMNEHWVRVMVQACDDHDQHTAHLSATQLRFSGDDR